MLGAFLTLTVLGQPASHDREMSCPDGFDLFGKRCVRERIETPSVKCPRGINQLGLCIHSERPAYKCEAGFDRKGKVCERRTQIDRVKKIAPVGYIDTGKDYLRTKPRETVMACQSGEMINGRCEVEKFVPSLPKRYCPGGVPMDSKGCQVVVPLKLQPVCEEGNYLDGHCVKFTEESPKLGPGACPPNGDFQKVGDKCIASVQGGSVLLCQDGSEPILGECLETVSVPIEPVHECPPGYDQVGDHCLQKIQGSLKKQCPPSHPISTIDSSMEQGCMNIKTAPIQKHTQCPEGFEEHVGKAGCWKTFEYPCDPEDTGKEHSEGLRGVKERVVAKTCEKKIEADFIEEYTCPEEFEKVGLECVKKSDIIPKEEICDLANNESTTLEECVTHIRSNLHPIEECPMIGDIQSTLNEETGFCEIQLIEEPTLKCKSTGRDYDETCVVTLEASITRPKICRPGYQLEENGELCKKVERSRPEMVCENQQLPVDDCNLRDYTAPIETLVCPDGAVQRDFDCYMKTILAPIEMCEDGSKVEDCSREERLPYEYQCPHFAIEGSKGRCFEKQIQGLHETCESGDLIHGMCVSTLPSINVCPKGTRLVGGQCYGKEFAQPKIEYVATCYGKGCHLN